MRGGSADSIAELAVDVDFEFFMHNGADEAATIAAVQAMLDVAGGAFLAGPGVVFDVTAIVVRSTADDPYSATDAAGIFAEARSEWAALDIPHDLVVLVSGKNLSGGVLGVAGLSGLCTENGVAVIAPTPVKGSMAPVILTHELGHVFGAPHCDGDPDCRIMCAFLGGCGPTDSFGPSSVAAMLEFIGTDGGCLDSTAGCPADLADPSGVLDLADVQAFIAAFVAGNPLADLAPPVGVLDLADVQAFIGSFLAGCP